MTLYGRGFFEAVTFTGAQIAAPQILWLAPPAALSLAEHEVHVWRAALDQPAATVQALLQTLTPDERGRAERFHFPTHREHFVVARGVLRNILSRYLKVEPGTLRFRYGQYGKPALRGDELRFNVAHANGLALYAVTRRREVGLDLEYATEDCASTQLAERFFSRKEVEMLRALPPANYRAGFFNCWTRKEAYLKARGTGLSVELNQFDVSLAPGEPASLLSSRENAQEVARWSMRELAPGPRYAAALVVEGHDWQLNRWQWRSPLE
ncbi:MAG: 4'-phosphopantetheinyl transferase [Acidobacteria bacterium]|nr:MAG: 4'-phosphopantetheinyl transferase [Acidobacteriota bacterium]